MKTLKFAFFITVALVVLYMFSSDFARWVNHPQEMFNCTVRHRLSNEVCAVMVDVKGVVDALEHTQ